MQRFVQPPRLNLLTAIVLLLSILLGTSAETLRYSLVSREIFEARLQKYKGSDQQREATLKGLFAEAGCDNQHLSEQPVKDSKLPNIVCRLAGSTEKVIIVGAHFDHVSKGDGVADNWSGASLLPSLYEAVKAEPRKHSYVFVGFTDEEKGEIGSHFYANQMTEEQVAATDAMVNMDTLGLAPTEVWATHSDKKLTGALFYIAKQLKIPVTSVNVDYIGSADSVQFSNRKIPSITIHTLTQETWNARIIHSSKDNFSVIKLDDYYETYKLLSAYLAFLDQVLGA